MPSYGGARRLPNLLDALRAQETDLEWEVIIVLDGTPDDSREVVLSRYSDMPLRIEDLPRNRGRSGALNAGFAIAQGEVLIRCDDDLVPERDYVAAHAKWHIMNKESAVIGLYRNVFPDTPYARAWGRHAEHSFRETVYGLHRDRAWRLWAGNCSLHRSMFDKVGPYDEAFHRYGWEDTDFGYRLLLAGATVRLDPALETIHRGPSTTTAIRVERAFRSGQAHARFVRKHGVDPDAGVPDSRFKVTSWAALVRTAATGGSSNHYRAAGAAVDHVLPRLPVPVGRRLVGLTIEAAGLAGFRHHGLGTEMELG